MAIAFATALGCTGEDILGVPDEPLDGAWSFDGVFSDIEAGVRCRLSGDATLSQDPSGMSVSGSGTTVLDCDVNGEAQRFEMTSPVGLGRLTDGAISFSLGLCGFNGRYLGPELEGAAGCVFALSPAEDVGTVGHWRAFRADVATGVTP